MSIRKHTGSTGPAPERTPSMFKRWGARGVLNFALFTGVTFVAILVLYINVLDEPLGDTGIGNTHILPTTGAEGFNLEAFCEDSLTKVKLEYAPDGSAPTYQITRTRDGVFESAKVIQGVDTGTHYWDDASKTVVQQSEPAYVSDKAKECLERKSKE